MMTDLTRDLRCRELARLVDSCDPSDPNQLTLTAIDRHIAECPVCQGAESILASAVSRYRDQTPDFVSDDFSRALIQRLCTDAGGAKDPG